VSVGPGCWSWSELQQECECGKDRGRNERLDIDRPRLTQKVLRFSRVRNRLLTCVHVAQTARRKPHSRSITCLEEAETGNEEREKERKAPDWADAGNDAENGDHDAYTKRYDSKYEALAAFLRANIGDARC
jgi:hypothetical protein